jgi:hypothetical protein
VSFGGCSRRRQVRSCSDAVEKSRAVVISLKEHVSDGGDVVFRTPSIAGAHPGQFPGQSDACGPRCTMASKRSVKGISCFLESSPFS